MDFSPSATSRKWLQKTEVFFERYVLPHNAAWHQSVADGVYPPPFLADLKALAQDAGLWNLCLPSLPFDAPGTRLSNLEYAPIAELLGRLPWASEVFNCHAPDSGNMELLLRFADAPQSARWLALLLHGAIRSAFAMSEPDVASSDPANLQTSLRREGDTLVLQGRKWFITGAAHPDCRLLIVMCRDLDLAAQADTDAHRQHSLVLVPMDAPGVEVLRNIPVLHHLAPEGHCEIVLQGVRLGPEALLGQAGAAFAMAQARLGPGRLHHGMRSIGQCELALQLACTRVREREAFGQHVSKFSNVQDWIAQSRVAIDQARLLLLHTAWRLDQPVIDPHPLRSDVAAVKVVTAQLQTQVVDRAMQMFGAMGLSPDTPLAYFWSWGRAMHLMDGPDAVHLRTIARHALRQSTEQAASLAAYFTTPEQLRAAPQIR
jgi:acyl-CoA dehydrogenase